MPEARIAVAHGKMGEHKLEQVVLDFWEKRFDVLVCTTIVETGLDISNANTLIVERADRLGLSQLHQLRGRVGRGRERAYSYFLYPPEAPLTETALDRLQTIASNTDLGVGHAGGDEGPRDPRRRQPARRRAVGAHRRGRVRPLRAAGRRGGRELPRRQPTSSPTEIKIELPVDAHLPHDYVPHERLRLEMYKKLAAVVDEAQLADIEAELVDRYGAPPEPVRNLLEVARLRTVARAAGIGDISLQGNHVRFGPLELRESQELRLQRLYPGSIVKHALGTVLVPKPMTARVGGPPAARPRRARLGW